MTALLLDKSDTARQRIDSLEDYLVTLQMDNLLYRGASFCCSHKPSTFTMAFGDAGTG
jgi:hypothetical protein